MKPHPQLSWTLKDDRREKYRRTEGKGVSTFFRIPVSVPIILPLRLRVGRGDEKGKNRGVDLYKDQKLLSCRLNYLRTNIRVSCLLIYVKLGKP